MSTRYKIRQKLLSIGDDFWIENQKGDRVFKVDGKALRLRKTLIFEDIQGNTLAKIQERLLPIKETMVVEDAEGNQLAVIKKGLIAPLGDHWSVNVRGGPDLDVQGNILDHEYSISERRNKIAEVSKAWFSLTDTYGVEIDDGQNDILILATAIAIDMMAHDDDNKRK
ncbi:MAG: LURP-one-related/scramblase family protein [Byssovorax cruenta]